MRTDQVRITQRVRRRVAGWSHVVPAVLESGVRRSSRRRSSSVPYLIQVANQPQRPSALDIRTAHIQPARRRLPRTSKRSCLASYLWRQARGVVPKSAVPVGSAAVSKEPGKGPPPFPDRLRDCRRSESPDARRVVRAHVHGAPEVLEPRTRAPKSNAMPRPTAWTWFGPTSTPERADSRSPVGPACSSSSTMSWPGVRTS